MRNRDTSAATAARVRAKHERWIKELTDAGYFVTEPRDGIVVYADGEGRVWGRSRVRPDENGNIMTLTLPGGGFIGLAGVTWYR